MLWRSFWGHPENFQGTSRINLPGTSCERHIRMFPGWQFRTSHDVRSWRPGDGQMGSLGDVLGTNICRLRKYLKKINTELQSLHTRNKILNPKLPRLLCNDFDYECISWYPLVSKRMRKKIHVNQIKYADIFLLWLTRILFFQLRHFIRVFGLSSPRPPALISAHRLPAPQKF